ncbi:Uroporphyrinogen decarboxylase (URO-D) [Sporobacter termitidis DSM 10068]|uniref:Uroporphyrinogen decarboxylase (URO-D) n=1 Tax=Sporobacter termitidis DSM 10068 TaxID=1123282 RepID=A0A1M5YZT6_9FIRM|nr:uroporphyrinogen decarboxylase family protein [Sporobacter termitidis]SHI17516.1 Uroporphyrinogen decarboxylase (URO-D) [Sporobacter termitidis DSM 10068]
MRYPRPAYGDSAVKTEKVPVLYGSGAVEVPKFDTPISPRENFRRAAARQAPLWVPNSLTDFQNLMTLDVVAGDVRGMQMHTDFRRNAREDYVFIDWFKNSWTWVCSAGGAMLTPGTRLLDDITEWERAVQWPDLSEWDFKTPAERFMKNDDDPAKALHYDIGRGATERLIAVLGGYTEGMLALAMEPEAVRDFLERFADFEIELFELLYGLYPLDMVTYHDDWGTERDTFFSEKMLEEIVFPPTKRIIDHIRSRGVAFELHSCGNITRFLPYMVALQADFLQIQRRAVDIPAMKEKYGESIGFNTGIEGMAPGAAYTAGEIARMVKNTVDLYGKHGGFYATVSPQEPMQLWETLAELYACSREYYEAQQNKSTVFSMEEK